MRYHADKGSLQDYWRNPSDDRNLPQRYLSEHAGRQFLVDLVQRYAKQDWALLEIGCNAGANLNRLYREGFTKLGGVEINTDAVRLLRETFPDLASHVEIHNAPVEDVIQTLPDGAYDIVFTMAVLEHIHRESEWTFREIARVAKEYVITIENEKSSGWGHFRRNYRKVFMELGLKEVESRDCRAIEGLGIGFVARVLKKTQGEPRKLLNASR